jgi:transposase
MAQALRHRRQNPNSNIKRQSPRHVCRPPSGKQLDDVDAPAPAGGYDADRPEAGRGAFTMAIVTIGLDLAKSGCQAHGVDETGATALMKRLHRKQMAPFFSKLPRCLIAMEACGTAHYWARTLVAMGHEVRLIPPSYVRAYVKRGKSDALDADAICEAVQRPAMRFVPVKTVEQQSILMAHRARSLLVLQRTMLANALRAHLAEFDLVANPGIANLAKLAQQALSDENGLPSYARTTLEALVRQIMTLSEEITALDRKLLAWHAESEVSQRLTAIPGLGIVTATAIAAHRHRSGPVPVRQTICRLARPNAATAFHRRQDATRGHLQARRPIPTPAARCWRHSGHPPHERQANPMANWIRKLLVKKPFRVVSVALANKLARIAWVVLTRKEAYRPYQLAA